MLRCIRSSDWFSSFPRPRKSYPHLDHKNTKGARLGPGPTDLLDLGLPFGPISDIWVTYSRCAAVRRIALLGHWLDFVIGHRATLPTFKTSTSIGPCFVGSLILTFRRARSNSDAPT
jgi:hypothetical protein